MTSAESSKQRMYTSLKFNRVGAGDHTLAMRGYVLEPVEAAIGWVKVKLCYFRASFIENLSAFCL